MSWSIPMFVVAAGFVCAALLTQIHRAVWAQNEAFVENQFLLSFDGVGAVFWSMFICVFAGPYLVLSQGYYFWRREMLPISAMALCTVVSVVWSFCSGVFVMEAAILIGIIAV